MQVVPEHMAAEHSNTPMKIWETWPGTHYFCCDGRVMVGPDIGVTGFAAALTTGASVAFWIFVTPTLPLICTVAGMLLYALTMMFMVLTATTDPGILPANRSMDAAEADACAATPRSVVVDGVTLPLKWCRTCRIYRPPRAAHCSECNVCVERFDHHCPWMGQCIGRRNYRYFIGFVISVCVLCAYTLTLSAYVAYHAERKGRPPPYGDWMSRVVVAAPIAAALVCFPGAIVLCVAPLACYHCSLVCSNTTTSEEIKEVYGDHNPFSKGTVENCHEVCCADTGRAKVVRRAFASEPERLDTCQLIRSGQVEEVEAVADDPPAGAAEEVDVGRRTAPKDDSFDIERADDQV